MALCDRSEIGPWIWYRSMLSTPRRSHRIARRGEQGRRTLSFQACGMNFDAITTRIAARRVRASRRPMMRSLSPLP